MNPCLRVVILNILLFLVSLHANASGNPLGMIGGFGLIKENYAYLADQLNPGYLRFTVDTPKQSDLFDQYMRASSGKRQLVVTVNKFRAGDQAYLDFIKAKARQWGGDVRFWMLGNELDLDANYPTDEAKLDEYVRGLIQFHQALTSVLPNARVAISFSGQAPKNGHYKKILTRLERDAPRLVSIVDLHYHKPWRQAENIGQHIRLFRDYLDTLPSFRTSEITFTENSTWSGAPELVKRVMKLFPPQSEFEQAVYCVESFYTARASGIDTFSCGIVRDRAHIRGNTAAHPFTLNGHLYNPERNYGFTPTGPAKVSAYTFRLLSWLTEAGIQARVKPIPSSHPGLTGYIHVGGKRSHAIIWLSDRKTPAGEGSTVVRIDAPFPGDLVYARMVDNTKGVWPIESPAKSFAFEAVRRIGTDKLELDLPMHSPVVIMPASQLRS